MSNTPNNPTTTTPNISITSTTPNNPLRTYPLPPLPQTHQLMGRPQQQTLTPTQTFIEQQQQQHMRNLETRMFSLMHQDPSYQAQGNYYQQEPQHQCSFGEEVEEFDEAVEELDETVEESVTEDIKIFRDKVLKSGFNEPESIVNFEKKFKCYHQEHPEISPVDVIKQVDPQRCKLIEEFTAIKPRLDEESIKQLRKRFQFLKFSPEMTETFSSWQQAKKK
eukprot:TRINITY_DN7221_c0_g1_i1.p1 TRINITY_DN7221_c0_g1~~TRINITY_DN7221_c0_g1_i1.p1  ORF type:complete len:221 (+),score=72.77 TRINITY_DN7221_c0_g1_i1:411-1073(+)